MRVTGILLSAMSLVLSACVTSYGAKAVAPSGYGYNTAIAQSVDQQLLLNLVRLRYRDTVVFMDITSVTTQHQYSAGLSAENALPFRQPGNGASLLVPSAGYSESPTVSYAPVTGTEFATNLLSPISAETIVLLASSGWSIERLLSCCIERLGDLSNAPSASGPTPATLPDNQAFRRLATLLRQLQLREQVYVERVSSMPDKGPETFLVINATTAPECEELKHLLSSDTCAARYNLVTRGTERSGKYLLAQTRTVLGALYALSHSVQVPDQHASAGFVTVSRTSGQGTQTWQDFLSGKFTVRSQASEPSSAFVKIQYRDHWFWIDDSDLETKTTFSLILFLLSLQSAASEGMTPLLTIGTG